MKTHITLKDNFPHDEQFPTVGTNIDPQEKISVLSDMEYDSMRNFFKRHSDDMFEEFEELQQSTGTNMEWIHEELEELHSEMGATLLKLQYARHPERFHEENS